MPDSTTSTTSTSDWLTPILNAVATIWGIRQSGQTPNFYPAPLTPQEQWKTDASKQLFDLQSGYAKQFIEGTSNLNPDYKLNTSEVGNPAFMGGIHVPTFDVSKLNFPSSGATAPTTTPNRGQTGEGSGPTGVTGDPFGHVTSPAGGPGDPFAGWPDASPTAHNVTWADIQKYGPEAVKYATSLLNGGMPLAAIVGIVAKMFGHGQTLPVHDLSGKVDLTPAGGPPARTPVTPPTGAQQAGGAFINNQNAGLATDPGQLPPGPGSPGFGWGIDYNKFQGGGQQGFGTQIPGGGRYKP
jgi:hypothetical protein